MKGPIELSPLGTAREGIVAAGSGATGLSLSSTFWAGSGKSASGSGRSTTWKRRWPFWPGSWPAGNPGWKPTNGKP